MDFHEVWEFLTLEKLQACQLVRDGVSIINRIKEQESKSKIEFE